MSQPGAAMAEGADLITRWAGPDGEALVVEHQPGRGVVIGVQGDGVQAQVCIPLDRWFAMALEIYASRWPMALWRLANDR